MQDTAIIFYPILKHNEFIILKSCPSVSKKDFVYVNLKNMADRTSLTVYRQPLKNKK